MKEYLLTVGLEVHVQLNTKSKMFCSCSAAYFGEEPNTHVCPVCLGLPGALPVANAEAINKAYQIGLGLNCEIPNFAKFDRKNYFYPDLAKGFQISQFDKPFAISGYIVVGDHKIRINRAHLEEDTGKLVHGTVDGEMVSLIDFNRSGVPLMEIVSEPDLESAVEAREYAQKLNLIVKSLGVADADMEKAGMRFDANVSLRPKGQKELGTKVEIKNINSFRFLEKAINYEYGRQVALLEKGEIIVQETRGWVESKGSTQSQRTKEFSPDYRYFPEPDLSAYTITDEQLNVLKSKIPLLPDQLVSSLQTNYGIDKRIATTLVEKDLEPWFKEALLAYSQTENPGLEVSHIDQLKAAKMANWISGELLRILNDRKIEVSDLQMEPARLAELLYEVDKGEISVGNAKLVLDQLVDGNKSLQQLLDEFRSSKIEAGQLSGIIDKVIEANPNAVADYSSGKEQAVFFLVGQVARETHGSVGAAQVKEILVEKLNARKT